MAIFVAIAIAFTAVSYYQAKKAQKQARKLAESMAGVLVTKDSTIESVPVIYGERRVGGTRVFLETVSGSEGKHEYLYMAIVLSEGEVESIDLNSIHFDDKPLAQYGLYAPVDNQFTTYTEEDLGRLAAEGISVHDANASQSDLFQVEGFIGTDFQQASAILTAAPSWTNDHRLQGVAYLAIRLKWNEDVFSGVPSVSVVVRGKKVYDARKDSTSAYYNAALGVSTHRTSNPGTWEYSTNPALCLRDYLTNERYGKGLPESTINDDLFYAAADDIETFEVTPYSGATTDIPLFQLNAVIDTSEEIFKNVENILMATRGFFPFSNGKYGLKIDQSTSSVLTIDSDIIIGGISVKGPQKEERFNIVEVKYPNKNLQYQPDTAIWPNPQETTIKTSFPDGQGDYLTEAELYAQFVSEDNGFELKDDIDLEFVTNYYVARDMARIFCLRSRYNMAVEVQCSSEAIDLVVGDVVSVEHPTVGWTSGSGKLFQVDAVTLKEDGTVDLILVEYTSSIYSYDPANEEVPYVDTELPDPFLISAPTNVGATSQSALLEDGTLLPRLGVTWTASEDKFVSSYEVGYKLTGSTEYSIAKSNGESALIEGIKTGTYDVAVRSVNSMGIKSAWATKGTSTDISADTTAPDAPTSVTATGGVKSIELTWDNPSDADFKHVEIYVNTTNTIPATPTAKVDGESYVHGGLTAGDQRYFWLKSVDFTGNKSDATTSVNATAIAVAAGTDVDVDFADVTGTTKPADNATKNDGALADKDTVGETDIDDGAVSIDKIASSLQSTNYVAGTSGWKLTKAGEFEAGSGTFRGALTATSLTLDSGITIGSTNLDQTVVDGASAGSTALQDSDTGVNLGLTGGTVGGITVTSTELYQGAGNFNNADTGFYLDNTGQFSLKDKLSFDGTDLTVSGKVSANDFVVTGNSTGVSASSTKDGAVTATSLSASAIEFIDGRILNFIGATTSTSYPAVNLRTDYSSPFGGMASGVAEYINLGSPTAATHGVQDVELSASVSLNWEHTGYSGSGNLTVTLQRADNSAFTANLVDVKTASSPISFYYFGGYLYYTEVSISAQIAAGTLTTGQDYYYRLKVVSDVNVQSASQGDCYIALYEAAGVESTGGDAGTFGSLTVAGDLTVNGTTVTLNTATLDVEDKNITLNYGEGDTSSNANGAGITIQDAVSSGNDATLTWNTTSDQWVFSHPVKTSTITTLTSYDSLPEGVYGSTSTSVGPYANHHVVVSFDNPASAGRKNQLFFPDSNQSFYFRNRQGDVTGWHPWHRVWSDLDFSSTDVTNWDTAYSWGDHDGLYLPIGGGALTGDTSISGDLTFTGTATTTNQSYGIFWTGFDKEGTTDFSDNAYIIHTVNSGGHSGSVLLISSQNDAGDGIAFSTHASSRLKHNSYNIWTEKELTTTDKSNYDTAYGWGDHDGLYYTKSVSDGRYTRRHSGTSTIPSDASYVRIARVTGDRLGSAVKVAINGTSNSVVINVVAEIMCNHSGDIVIDSISGNYTQIYLKVQSNVNENFDLYARVTGVTAGNTGVSVDVHTYNSEAVTINPTDTAYTGTVHEQLTEAGRKISGSDSGGRLSVEDNVNLAANLYMPQSHSKTKIGLYGSGGSEFIGTSSSTLELSGTNINLNGASGSGTAVFKMGGTTTIDSSRNFVGNSFNVPADSKIGTTTSAWGNSNIIGELDRLLEIGVDNTTAASYPSASGVVFHHGGVSTSAIKYINDSLHNGRFAFDTDDSSFQGLYMNGTQFINGARDLVNIGTINSTYIKNNSSSANVEIVGDNSYQYALRVEQKSRNDNSTYGDTLFVRNNYYVTSPVAQQKAQIGLATTDADGDHHRAQIWAERDGGTAAGKLILATRPSSGNPTPAVTIYSNQRTQMNGTLTTSDGYNVDGGTFRSNYRRDFYVGGQADRFYLVKIRTNGSGDKVRFFRAYSETIGGSSSYWNNGSTTHFGALNLVIDTLNNAWGGHRSVAKGTISHNYTTVCGRVQMGSGSEYQYLYVFLRGNAGGSGALYHVEKEDGHIAASDIIVDYNSYITTADARFNNPYANWDFDIYDYSHHDIRVVENLYVGATATHSNARVNIEGTLAVRSNDTDSRAIYIRDKSNNVGNIVQFQDYDGNNIWEMVGRNNDFYFYKGSGTGAGYKYRVDSSGNSSIGSGNFNVASGAIQVGGTTVIDSSRNFVNGGSVEATSYFYTAANGLRINRAGQNSTIWFTGSVDTNHCLWNGYYGDSPTARGAGNTGFDGMIWNAYRGLRLRGGVGGGTNIILAENSSGSTADHYVRLFASGTERLRTTTGGVNISGQMESTSFYTTDKSFVDGGHSTARVIVRYKHGGADYSANNGILTLWSSEPGITYYGSGIGANVNTSGQYYGREDNNLAYAVYQRFNPATGYAEIWTSNGAAGTIGGQGSWQFSAGISGIANARAGFAVNGTTVIDSSRNLTNIGTTYASANTTIPFQFVKTSNAQNTGSVALFESTYGNHSWGINTEHRIAAASGDRPSILFSNGGNTQTWSIGYGYNDTGYFRIKRDHGRHNSNWGTALMTMDRSGNVTFAGDVTAFSDARLKENIETIKNPLDIIKQIRGVSYNWIESGKKSIGVIAQEIEQVPELACLVSENADDGSSEFRQKNVAYGNMVGVLIEAIKEQQSEIDQLKELVKKLLEK